MVLNPGMRIFVAGHRGMVGSAIVRRLAASGYEKVITRTRQELDLTDQQALRAFFRSNTIDYVVIAAAKVGGILANNSCPADFIYQNLLIETLLIHEAFRAGIRRLLFLGSSCIYPKFAPQPMREEHLLTGPLEPTNEPYAVAKIAGIKLCESYNRQHGTQYRSLMPTNLYGPNDNFDLLESHALAAMLRKFHLAKLVSCGDRSGVARDVAAYGPIPEDIAFSLGIKGSEHPVLQAPAAPAVRLWGTGTPRREFLHVDDLASACLFVMGLEDGHYRRFTEPMLSHLNVGVGKDIAIAELADLIADVVGYRGDVQWDSAKPDGTPRKLLDVAKLQALGWTPQIGLAEGVRSTYAWYRQKPEGCRQA